MKWCYTIVVHKGNFMDETLTFKIEGERNGRPIHPKQMLLSEYNEFSSWVESFVYGKSLKEKSEPSDSYFEVIDNCVQINTKRVGQAAYDGVTSFIDGIISNNISVLVRNKKDIERLELLTSLQKKVCANDAITISNGKSELIVSLESDFNYDLNKYYLDVELYVFGEIFQVGGKGNPNIHLSCEESDDNITISMTKEEIIALKDKLKLYENFSAQCSAKQHIITGKKKDYRFIKFYPYYEKIDEGKKHESLSRSAKAWAGIDAKEYIEHIRGNDDRS